MGRLIKTARYMIGLVNTRGFRMVKIVMRTTKITRALVPRRFWRIKVITVSLEMVRLFMVNDDSGVVIGCPF